MTKFVDHPAIVFLSVLALLILAVAIGVFILRRAAPLGDEKRDDFNAVQGATFTLLALLIGFSVSMAVSLTISERTLRKLKQTRSAPSLPELTWRSLTSGIR